MSRSYYFGALLLVAVALVLFLHHFEKRKPRVRELVLIAVMAALIVGGRIIFFMLPQMKPVAAMIIITGICLGPETGSLVAVVSVLVSNIFFGQGPWTPWQMFAFGVIGYLAGKLFGKKESSEKTAVCFYGFFSVLLIYGGIMNPAALMMYSADISPASLAAVYLSGLPMDLLHAEATVLFLWLGYEPIRKKLLRVKWKYGVFIS